MLFRVCGDIDSLQDYHWYVDQLQRQEDVSITMKSVGINDGRPEGMSFNISGMSFDTVIKIIIFSFKETVKCLHIYSLITIDSRLKIILIGALLKKKTLTSPEGKFGRLSAFV